MTSLAFLAGWAIYPPRLFIPDRPDSICYEDTKPARSLLCKFRTGSCLETGAMVDKIALTPSRARFESREFFLVTKRNDVASGAAFSREILWLSGCAAHRPSCSRHHGTKRTSEIANAKNENHRRCHGLSCRWHGPCDKAGVNAAALPVQSPVKMWPCRTAC